MPINSKHPEYDSSKSMLTHDANYGNVKDYVPRLVGQSSKEYEQYRDRAVYYNITKRTNAALTGAILRKPYSTNIDVDIVQAYGGLTFDEFLSQSISDVLIHGRIGILVDYDNEIQYPYIVSYPNGKIINWRYEHGILSMVVLEETTFIPKEDDPYDYQEVVRYRELYLDENGLYAVRLWQEGKQNQFDVVEMFEPTIRGSRLDYIPFVFANTKTTTPDVEEPTLFNIAEINISHFRTSADIEHCAHFTALPQPWLSGDLKEETSSLPIGTYEVWQLEEGAKVGYLEFNGNGIKSLQEIAKSKEEAMIALGASLLQGKKGVESAEALRIRQGSESSTLVQLTTSIESAMQQVLTLFYRWLGNETEVEFVLNKDFTNIKLSPQELKALMDAYIAGTISQDTFLHNLYEGEIVKDVENEKNNLNNM